MKAKIFLVLMLPLSLLSSCGISRKKCLDKFPPSITQKDTRIITVTEQVHDTAIFTKEDSSSIKALLACDSLGNVYLKRLNDINSGKNIKPPSLNLQGNVLTAKCEVDSYAVYLTWKTKNVTDSATSQVKETMTIPVNYLTGWQWFQVWLGRIFGVLLSIGAAYLIIKLIRIWM